MASIQPADPEIILFNGTLATQDPKMPMAQAVATGKGRILAVGSDHEVLRLAGAETERIDLNGRLLTPGLMDAHIHFYEWALKRQGVKLDDLTSLEALLERIGRAAGKHPPDQWIMGQGWNETDWSEPRMPTREALDRAVPNHPVLLWRCDLHLAAANSKALKLAGINARTPDPPEGRIDRDARGKPTGILRELAINMMRQAMASPGADQVSAALAEGFGALHRRGITGIHDVRLMDDKDGARAFRAFQELERDGRLMLRTWVSLPGDRLEDIIGLGLRTGFGNARLRVGHVKYFSDGGMGARTAWMIDPYLDAQHGMPLMDMEALGRQIGKAEQAGLSVMVHAVGDRANRELIRLFEKQEKQRALKGALPPAIPHRIEHVQMIRPEDALRLGGLNLGLCVTPANMVLDMNLIDSAVGARGKWAYAFRRLLDSGAPVMFSSDCPVCDPAPLPGIHAAVTRQRGDGTPRDGWHPGSRITVAEALKAYTATPAACHQAGSLGSITPGKMADLAIFSKDILTLPATRLPEVQIDMTLFNGRIVHRRF